jgi:predicted transposase YdaD
MATKPYDQAFKFLAEQDPEALLLMLGAIEPDEKAVIELLPREISMVEYGPLHWFKYLLPVDSYVILLTKKGLPRRPPQVGVITAGGTRIETRFHLIRVWKIPARKALAGGRPALLPFVPLMDGGREEMKTAAEALQSMPDERQRREMNLHFVMLAGLRYNHDDVEEMLGGPTSMMPIERLRESSFYQLILEEGREEERLRLLKVTSDNLRQLIAKRFPGVQLGEELEAIGDPDILQRLFIELDDIHDPDTLRRRISELATMT